MRRAVFVKSPFSKAALPCKCILTDIRSRFLAGFFYVTGLVAFFTLPCSDCYRGTLVHHNILALSYATYFSYFRGMKGVTFLKDESNNHRLMQIDLVELAKDAEAFEDVCDLIAIELRKEEEAIPWAVAKESLQEYGKKAE